MLGYFASESCKKEWHMKSCKEKAIEWALSERTVSYLCKNGKVLGAELKDGKWQIPDDAQKPADGRIRNGKYRMLPVDERKRPLPVGISEYVRAQSE